MRFLFLLLLFSSIKPQLIGQQTVGIFQNTEQASDDYTLFGNNKTIYLIDQCGFIVNTWESNFDPGLTAYLLENGNLLRTAKIDGFFGASGISGRFELFNWEGELIWNFQYSEDNIQAHHDIEPLPNGNFLAIVWEKISEAEAQQNGRKYEGEVWSEKIIEFEITENDQANIVWEWRLWDQLIQDHDSTKANFGIISEHPELVDLNYIGAGESTDKDWIHLNAISYNAELDQIALSSRHLSEIWIIDHSTSTEEAQSSQGGNSNRGGNLLYRFGNPQIYQRGTPNDQVFFKQHDIRWVPNGLPFAGSLMVFNNFENGDSISSVKVWTPPLNNNQTYNLSSEVPYGPSIFSSEYTNEHFFSKNISGAHFLENGNLFITEGRNGRFFEVTPEKEKVWEYISPSTRFGQPIIQGEEARFNDVFRATKYTADYAGLADKILTSDNPIERNPLQIECDTSQVIDLPLDYFEVNILGNPVDDVISFDAIFDNQNITVKLTDISGKEILQQKINIGRNEISTINLSPGIFLLYFTNSKIHLTTFKIIKI